MKTARKIWELLPAVMVITLGYLTAFSAAADSPPAPHPALFLQVAQTGARAFLPVHHGIEIISKFPSIASMSAFPNYECEAECYFWHSFRTSGRQEGDYPDHILSDNNAFVPYNDHILPDHDHVLPYPEYALHSGDEWNR